ncbi:MAG TPA: DNA recombination protein RmuC [Candidatus Cloacimonadota bacterium]|nr:DNA recombination protein RmuC [Candidatus Cloacimonadota bacterium]
MELTLIIITLVAVLINLIISLLKKPNTKADTDRLISMMQQELDRLSTTIRNDLSNHKSELMNSFSALKTELDKNLRDNRLELSNSLEILRKTVEERLERLQDSNSQKLEEMRQTVDEKLQKTLNTRLAESFKQVQDQLEKVHTGLGEMTNMAKDVGGLKNALTNVKAKGIIGEIQLEALLSSFLSPQQYEANVQIKQDSSERVEFAICLPGKDESGKPLYLPIDSKFPLAPYEKLLEAYDEADMAKITSARKELYNFVKSNAKTIRDKYIDPPNTTDWAIMFLPSEGLYAELLQNTQLVLELQREYQITLAGPTILGAYINSLQMGFKTLAIQKSSSEVWKLLGAVKTQFSRFGGVLESAQKRIAGVSSDLDTLVGTRTRMIQSKLQKVEELPEQEASALLEMDILELEEEEEDRCT